MAAVLLASGSWYLVSRDSGNTDTPAAIQAPVKNTEIETVGDSPSKPKTAVYGVSEALEDIASGKKAPESVDVSKLPLSNAGDMTASYPVLLQLRNSGSDIPEKLLTQKEYDFSALGLDPRVVLEGYVYQQYKARGAYDPLRIASMPIGSDGYLQLVLKEIYTNHPEDFAKFGDQLVKRQSSESSRRFNLITKMVKYAASGGKFDITDPTYVLGSQAGFFLKWPGWNDLNESERQVLYRGKRIFDRYATMKQSDFKNGIDKEISDFEAYLADYKKAGLDKFWPASYYLPSILGNLYAIKGDYDKGIEVFTKELDATKVTPRKEQSSVFSKDFNAVQSRIGFLYVQKAKSLEAAGKKSEALQSYVKAEKYMHDDLLVMPLTTPDVFAVWTDVTKKINTLK